MFHEVIEDAVAADSADADGDAERAAEAAALLAAFETLVQESVESAGRDRVVAETDLSEEAVTAAEAGDAAGLTVDEGAAVLAIARDRDVDAVLFELRDHLLMGMTTAVLDVDTVAGAVDADLTGQEVQQAVEGRADMTLAQLADIMAVIETRKR